MLARCHLEHWRDATQQQTPDRKKIEELYQLCDGAFQRYLELFPEGRFALDVPGWRVDLARERGDLNRLFPCSSSRWMRRRIRRSSAAPRRKCSASSSRRISGRNSFAGADAVLQLVPVEELARRPLAALAFVYHFLDSRSRKDFEAVMSHSELTEEVIVERGLLPVLRMRKAGRVLLPSLAQALAGQRDEMLRAWRPRDLAVLAWAATEGGDHRQAVRICELAGAALKTSDDLWFARAIALQRAGRSSRGRARLSRNCARSFRAARCVRNMRFGFPRFCAIRARRVWRRSS